MEILKRLAQPISADMTDILTDGGHYVAVTFDDGFQNIIENALPELIEREIPATIFIPTGYIGRAPDWIEDELQEDRYEVVMTEDKIKRLPREFITVGSHGVNHSNLRLLGEADLRRELIDSKSALQWITGRDITLLSIPYGEYDQKVVEAARQTGYQRIFSSLPRLAEEEEYIIQRVPAKPSDWPLEFRLKILGAYRWLPSILRLKRKGCPVMIKDLKSRRESSLIGNEY
jgi:peptidoglycan/xylan/chitin deacetylase (PgdA/CDA1 family)